ncbi:hypothetical protein LZ496_08825 [Sphingomonas sp. NSE70-1]|uniref:Uncharacterized protein n=1 Tax=Sphingomonas caseinilyticus TaxID=2908205 RepID=A0ABT0RVP1_9SPHN|nr:hypothetical protein [Sphingomonas caseinilyticus]MCL6698881.1 hypothetical protein [Sphingomonas caseinilyticus]
MAGRGTLWLAFGFVAGLLLMGIPFWQLPYNHQGFVYPGLIIGLAGLGVITAGLAASGQPSLKRVFWTMISAFPAAIAIRVAVEVAKDPTDHNLWPFELVYGFVMSAMAVVPGLLIGALARRLGR